MNNVIGHIIGIDEIHKRKLIRLLPLHIKVIDLDLIQQFIYEGKEITSKKLEWANLCQKIIIKKKQKALIKNSKNFDEDINRLLAKRNDINKEIHDIWKDDLSRIIDKEINKLDKYHILFIGFHIFPKDYRIRVNLPIRSIIISNSKISNKIIFNIRPKIYAANQIKFYLEKYSDRIIMGKFPLDLLNTSYLSSKYDKFTHYYSKLDYCYVDHKILCSVIKQLDEELSSFSKLSNKTVYVATTFKCKDVIPVMANKPIEGYFTKEEAIDNIRRRIKKKIAIYVYKIRAEQFEMIDGKLASRHELYPMDEESLLLT